MKRTIAISLLVAACSRGTSQSAPPDAAPVESAEDATSIARAEDLRRAKDVPAAARTSHDVALRRRSARALARIADAASVDGLVAHLADEDHETVAWAAYGLGYACKGREEAHVKLLVARAASLGPPVQTRIDPRMAIARSIGRCGATTSEQALLALLQTKGLWEAPALAGLGDLATRRKHLGAEAMTALLELAENRSSPRDDAFYALSRAEPGETFAKRVAAAAKAALARPGEWRILAIKALGRTGKEGAREAAPELGRVVVEKSFDAGERAEAARALANLGDAGRDAAASALAQLTPDKDPVAIQSLVGPDFHVLHTTIAALGAEPPKRAEPALRALSTIAPPAEPKPALARRLAELRCSAALALARGAYDLDVLERCDAKTSPIAQRARLAALLRRSLTGERRTIFRALAKSEHLRVREAAVEAISSHPELGDAAAQILAEALASKNAGLVATAAGVIHAHPERAMVLAASEKKAALDPKAPPPTANPAQELSGNVAKALAAALDAPWPEDRFETRIALIEAAASVRLDRAKAVASAACNDANVVVRERALKALRALGENVAACNAPDREAKPAPEIDAPLAKAPKITFSIEGLDLSIVLDPELAPVTSARIASLVKSKFFDGIVVHRVVPGFVVQFGDPEGDGYGGSGTSLRCETSPVPFAPLDVGMALAGRDTGSSQIFVTLSRTPHLDGEYTRIGKAEGDWASVAEGDVIAEARLSE